MYNQHNTCRTLQEGNQSHSLTPGRIANLEGIGFKRSTKNDTNNEWDNKFKPLEEYHEYNGCIIVPCMHNALRHWYSNQRDNFKKKNNFLDLSISNYQNIMLESIGFTLVAGSYPK